MCGSEALHLFDIINIFFWLTHGTYQKGGLNPNVWFGSIAPYQYLFLAYVRYVSEGGT
jgi:hypothetical protein